MSTYFVIGSNSFSGSDFIDLLLEDPQRRVIGVSRSPEKSALYLPYKRHVDPHFRFHQIDLNTDWTALCELITAERPEYIINFAALLEPGFSWKDSWQWFQTNTVALAKLGEFLKDQPFLKKYVHISTPEIYGSCDGHVTETAPYNPTTPYAASKAAGDMYLHTLQKAYNFPLVTIRSTNVYGPHQQLFRIIPRSIIFLKTGTPIELHGGGAAVKSFIHIRDVSRGELAALERGQPGSIFHLAPDEGGTSVRDLVHLVCQKMGKDFAACTRSVAERLGQDKAYTLDATRAHNDLGWRAQISLSEGVDAVIAWIESHWSTIPAEPLHYQHRL